MKIITVLFLSVFYSGLSFGTNPEYYLTAGNAVQTGANSLEFDIMMIHTNSSVSTFEYAGGQYFFDFNLNISNGGALIYSILSSDLPSALQPRNPVVYTTGGSMQLRLSINNIPNPGEGYIISSVLPGTKLARMRLSTNAETFSVQYFSLRWRNGPENPYTKIYAFVNSSLTEITNPAFHNIDSINHPLPVELTSFSSEIILNNVKLNWSTSHELNNSGFEIQRKRASDNEYKMTGFVNGNGSTNEAENYSFTDRGLQSGTYHYRLKQFDYNGSYNYYDLNSEVIIGLPPDIALKQNYPNPFNPETRIDYETPYQGYVTLAIYNSSGKEIILERNKFVNPGYYTVSVNFNNIRNALSSGIYFYKLTLKNPEREFVKVKKMMYLK
ncbi:MAG: T9SS type A sorting domain-containing protein [Bacteroidetes bacterium]|nr:T9SS type A sorting domain-containing protein [Bacteroidota bacterium]